MTQIIRGTDYDGDYMFFAPDEILTNLNDDDAQVGINEFASNDGAAQIELERLERRAGPMEDEAEQVGLDDEQPVYGATEIIDVDTKPLPTAIHPYCTPSWEGWSQTVCPSFLCDMMLFRCYWQNGERETKVLLCKDCDIFYEVGCVVMHEADAKALKFSI
jgi:hypothetical protein